MNVMDAARLVARDYPGGIEAVAGRLGKAATSLRHELDPGYRTAKFGLADAVLLTELTREMAGGPDLRIVTAFAAEVGAMLIPLPEFAGGAGDMAAMTDAVREFGEFGEYVARVGESLADGRVTDNELADTERELGQMVQAAQKLQAMLRARNQAAKPDHLRDAA